jgi:ABC-2 type transport system permease protein
MSETSTTHKVRPYVWSVRRELWEHPAIWIAPLAVMAVVLMGYVFGLQSMPKQLRIATDPAEAAASAARAQAGGESVKVIARTPTEQTAVPAPRTGIRRTTETIIARRPPTAAEQQAKSRAWMGMPYNAAAGAMFVTSWLVMIFYSLGALNGERRDRSVLFWKSLPVSDTTAVLAKATLPLVIQPLVILPIILAGHLIMLALGAVTFAASGLSIAQAWPYLHLPTIWTVMPYGLLVNVLWDVPFYGWLFVVSGWARKNTFVWAIAPWLGAALFEFLTFHTTKVLHLMQDRIFGGYQLAFSDPKSGHAVKGFSEVDVVGFLTSPGLWGGLAVGAGFFALAVWLRRTRDPI